MEMCGVIVGAFKRPIVVRLYESMNGPGLIWGMNIEDESGIAERDPSQVDLCGAAGFFFARILVLRVDQGDGIIKEFTNDVKNCEDRGPIYWCPGTTIGTEQELRAQFPDEADLINVALRMSKVGTVGPSGAERFARLCALEELDDDEDEVDEKAFVVYVRCSDQDVVLPNDHGANLDEAVPTLLN